MVTRMVVLATFCSFRLGHAKSGRFVGSWGTIYNKLMWDEQIFKETPFWGEDFQSKWHPENTWILFTKSKKKVHNTQPAECSMTNFTENQQLFSIFVETREPSTIAKKSLPSYTSFKGCIRVFHPPTSWFFIPQLYGSNGDSWLCGESWLPKRISRNIPW